MVQAMLGCIEIRAIGKDDVSQSILSQVFFRSIAFKPYTKRCPEVRAGNQTKRTPCRLMGKCYHNTSTMLNVSIEQSVVPTNRRSMFAIPLKESLVCGRERDS